MLISKILTKTRDINAIKILASDKITFEKYTYYAYIYIYIFKRFSPAFRSIIFFMPVFWLLFIFVLLLLFF